MDLARAKTQKQRKKLRKKAIKAFPGRDIRWYHGALHDFGPKGAPPGTLKPRLILEIPSPPKGNGGENPSADLPRKKAGGGMIIFDELPHAAASDGECNVCGTFPNSKNLRVTADQGKKFIIICGGCGNVMRPFQRAS